MSNTRPATATRLPLGEMLIRDGHLTRSQLQKGLEDQTAFGGRLGRHLVDLGFVTERTLLDALAQQLDLSFVDLDVAGVVESGVQRYARGDLCEQWGFCPVAYDERRALLAIAMSDPDPQFVRDLEMLLGVRLDVRVAPADMIERWVYRLYHGEEEQPVERMKGLQLSRSVRRDVPAAAAPAHDVWSGADIIPAPAGASRPAPPPIPDLDAQIAQQIALQQQLQNQIQQQIQQQLQLQQLAALAPRAVAPALEPPVESPSMVASPLSSVSTRAPSAENTLRPARGRRSAPLLPAPEGVSVDGLTARIEKLEQTLALQAEQWETTLAVQTHTMRALIDALVERGLVTTADIAQRRRKYDAGG